MSSRAAEGGGGWLIWHRMGSPAMPAVAANKPQVAVHDGASNDLSVRQRPHDDKWWLDNTNVTD